MLMDNYQEKYTLESVDYGSQLRGKSFVTSIGFSAWHWHYEYELMLVLKGKNCGRHASDYIFLHQGA